MERYTNDTHIYFACRTVLNEDVNMTILVWNKSQIQWKERSFTACMIQYRVFAVLKFVSCQFVYRFLECCNIRFRSFCKKKKENQCLFLFEIYQMGPYAELLQWNEKWNFFIQHQNSSNSIKIFSSGLHIRSHWFYFNF